MKHPELTSLFWTLTLPVKMVLCQLTYTTSQQINISNCLHRVVIQNNASPVFHTAKLSGSNASAPMNKLPVLGELKYHANSNHCFINESGIDRTKLIQYKAKNTNNRVPLPITYHPALSIFFQYRS
jgi:hypothetical protein